MAKEVIKIGRKRAEAPDIACIHDTHSGFTTIKRKFRDQDGLLSQQTDQHDQRNRM